MTADHFRNYATVAESRFPVLLSDNTLVFPITEQRSSETERLHYAKRKGRMVLEREDSFFHRAKCSTKFSPHFFYVTDNLKTISVSSLDVTHFLSNSSIAPACGFVDINLLLLS